MYYFSGEQDFRDIASDCACPFCSETFSDKEISLKHQSEVHQVDPADFKGTEIVTVSENITEDNMEQLKGKSCCTRYVYVRRHH